MKNNKKRLIAMITLALLICAFCSMTAFAASDTTTAVAAAADNSTGFKALAAGLCVGLAAAFAGIGMGIAIAKSSEGISRQPEAEGKIRTNLMLGLVFIETAIIYALIIAILIIFVL